MKKQVCTTGNISLLFDWAPTSNPGPCREILSQEQAIEIKRTLADRSPDSPTAEPHDKPSHLRASGSRSCVNDSPPTDLADPLKYKYTPRRETSDLSYVYRPTPIDVDPQHQPPFSSLPTSPPPTITTTSPAVSNRTTNSHQALDPIEEDEMPYDAFGNFVMNPLAPVFVPRQGGQPSGGGQLGQGSEPALGGRLGGMLLRLARALGIATDWI